MSEQITISIHRLGITSLSHAVREMAEGRGSEQSWTGKTWNEIAIHVSDLLMEAVIEAESEEPKP